MQSPDTLPQPREFFRKPNANTVTRDIIGKLRTIKAGTLVWSVQLQENIRFSQDKVVQVTNTCIGSDDVFAHMVEIVYNLPGFFPTVLPIPANVLEFMLGQTEEYEVPSPTLQSPGISKES